MGNENKIAFIDTEVGVDDRKIHDIGAVYGDKEFHSSSLRSFLDFIVDAKFICGHNIIDHDLKYLNINFSSNPKIIDTLLFSTLLFPSYPYHKLVKDYKLVSEDVNNPLNDAKLARQLFYDEITAFNALSEDVKKVYCNLLYRQKDFSGFFDYIGIAPHFKFFGNLPSEKETDNLIRKYFGDKFCQSAPIMNFILKSPVELAYALSIINTLDYHSICPPWVIKKYPRVDNIITLLTSSPCEYGCKYCREKLDIKKRLNDFFGYDSFRLFDGENLQEKAVEAAVKGKSLLAVFPTGGGKSLTFQLPALMAGEQRRGLSVVISPLQSLMKDQVDNLNERGIVDAVSINGLCSPVERAEAIRKVKSGLATIIYISPEALRSNTIEKLLLERNVVRFIIDEAHCFSAWGQDFRVDYLYIGDFIAKYQSLKNMTTKIPVSCFTATAKQKVISDIRDYFNKKLGLNLELYTTSSTRKNLHYNVLYKKDEDDKYRALRILLEEKKTPTICYVSRTKKSLELANRLTRDGFLAIPYNGKMEVSEKISNQEKFIKGEVNIIVATSAFGMGVDKKDVGLVVHYDISDSLENYVQEAGRAARDENINAECYVLFNENDLDKHFLLLNQTKVSIAEIAQVWKAIKDLTSKRKVLYASALEIARQAGWEDVNIDIETRVKTAISALENAGYIRRGKNLPRVYASSILVKNMAEAVEKIEHINALNDGEKEKAKRIIKLLISSKYKQRNPNEQAESRVDYVSDILGIDKKECITLVNIMRLNGILEDYMDITGFIKKTQDGKNHSMQILNQYLKLEEFVISNFKEVAFELQLKNLNESAKESGVRGGSVERIKTIIYFLYSKGYIDKKIKSNRDCINIVMREKLIDFKERFEKRESISKFIINYLWDSLADLQKSNSNDEIQIQFSLVELYKAYKNSFISLLNLHIQLQDIEDALLYLNRIKAIRLESGFLVLYSAMEIERLILDNKIRYKNEDYKMLDDYYKQKIQMIHIVGEYANLLVKDYEAALRFVNDYFKMDFKEFIQHYFKGERKKEIERNATPSKYNQIVKSLSPVQHQIIDDSISKYIVVIAGPGSGKTRILVNKLASMLLLEDVKQEQLLMLTFSRAAVSEFKKRLKELIGDVANYVEIKTFHSYCFDLLGENGNIEKSENIVKDAVNAILSNSGEIERERITKTVLVIDEAQDMDNDEFTLVKALIKNNDDLRVIAVGDDDQNIYEFRGSSSLHLKNLLVDYKGKSYEMLENYRSAPNIIALANYFANKHIKNRLKQNFIKPIKKDNGEVKIIHYLSNNMLKGLVNDLLKNYNGKETCILTTTNYEALQIYSLLNQNNIKSKLVQAQDGFRLYDIAEVRYFLKTIKDGSKNFPYINETIWQDAKNKTYAKYRNSICFENVQNMINEFEAISSGVKYLRDLEEFIFESNWEDFYNKSADFVYVSTIHKAKGREFENVYILLSNINIEKEENMRTLYVGMTRAKESLYIHTNTNLFDKCNISGVEKVFDKNQYEELNQICIQLTHRDVNLGFFKGKKDLIFRFLAGNKLQFKDDLFKGIINEKSYSLISLSKAGKEKLTKLVDKGYCVKGAEIRFILAWRDKDDETMNEIPIILPNLYLEKGN